MINFSSLPRIKHESMDFKLMPTVLSLALGTLLFSCQSKNTNEPVMKSTENDIHSFAQPAEARVKHLHWKANVNFDTKTIQAVASWTIEAKPDADVILFDTRGLVIEKITLDNDAPTTFKLAQTDS